VVRLIASSRFAVNPSLLPEYASTVLISLLVGSLLSASGRLPALPRDNAQVVAAGVAYGAVAALLLAATLRNRWRFPAVRIDEAGFSTTALGLVTGAFLWGRIDSVEVGPGRFFGRPARILTLKSADTVALEVPDHYFEWEDLVERASREAHRPVSRHGSLGEAEAEQLMYVAMERDALFGPRDSVLMFFLRLPIRALYLLPVAFLDVAAGLWFTAGLEGSSRHPSPAAAWAAPLSLAASAVISRWVSYTLVTSVSFRPLIFPTDPARLAQVRKLEEQSRRAR
jgi:hypothetical protein